MFVTAIARTPGAKILKINLVDENSLAKRLIITESGIKRMTKIPIKLNQKLYIANF